MPDAGLAEVRAAFQMRERLLDLLEREHAVDDRLDAVLFDRAHHRFDAAESIAARNAAGVLPESVGATTSACRPRFIAGHASTCAAVGAAKTESNHARTAG